MAEELLRTNLSRSGSTRTMFLTGELDVASTPVLEGAVDGARDGRHDMGVDDGARRRRLVLT